MWINCNNEWKRCVFIKKIDTKTIQLKVNENIINYSIEQVFKSNTDEEDNIDNLLEDVNIIGDIKGNINKFIQRGINLKNSAPFPYENE